jgi:cytochrome c553
MPSWYTELQLRKFREGVRGKPHQDLPGQQMRAIAAALAPDLAAPMAAHIAALKPHPTRPLDGAAGNADRGGAMFQEVCAKCHRYNGQGEQVFRSAPLTTLPGWYLAESLRKFRAGLRGYEHGDLDGPKMQEIASILGDPEIRDLVAYVATLAERYPPGENPRAARERSVTPIPLPE